MATLLVAQAVALALLAALVWGLLRTHAEILRSLHRLGVGTDPSSGAGGEGPHEQAVPLSPTPRRPPTATATAAVDLDGTTPGGEPVRVAVRTEDHDTLLAFLSSTCSTCSEFWRAFEASSPGELGLPAGTDLVIVTKGFPDEDAAGIARLAPPDHAVVMSTGAWRDYGVPSTPYFLLVDGPTGAIVGQGAGATWSQVSSLLGQASGDDRLMGARRRVAETEADVDRRLLAAGIRPGDPRLYPGGSPRRNGPPGDGGDGGHP